MSPGLTYTPAYLGLFASLLLAMACNVFLDIQYGSFTFEMVFWSVLLGWTLLIGWRQQGEASDAGRHKQKIVLFIAIALSLLFFIPKWGFPRAGVYMLFALQAAQNCVTTSRRQLHFGLLVSAVGVMFAASHYRADWTMLFYLVPYIVAVVFTLVAEQISRRADDIARSGLALSTGAGQGLAIASATAIILGLAGILYLSTPQITWPYLEWRYGQPTNLGFLHDEQSGEGSGGGSSGQRPADGSPGNGQAGQGGQAQGEGNAGESYSTSPTRGWPTPGEMREAARRPGMPSWQSGAIMQMANLDEAIGEMLAPLKQQLQDLLNQAKAWMEAHRDGLLASLMALIMAILLLIFAYILREARAATWLRTRYDYLTLVLLRRHDHGSRGARQVYRAMERLFLLLDHPRPPASNAREFLREATYYREQLIPEASELTRLFEEYRYGPQQPDALRLERMLALYRALFAKAN